LSVSHRRRLETDRLFQKPRKTVYVTDSVAANRDSIRAVRKSLYSL
jgi:hypothetical protein